MLPENAYDTEQSRLPTEPHCAVHRTEDRPTDRPSNGMKHITCGGAAAAAAAATTTSTAAQE